MCKFVLVLTYFLIFFFTLSSHGPHPDFWYFLFQKYCGLYAGKYGTTLQKMLTTCWMLKKKRDFSFPPKHPLLDNLALLLIKKKTLIFINLHTTKISLKHTISEKRLYFTHQYNNLTTQIHVHILSTGR